MISPPTTSKKTAITNKIVSTALVASKQAAQKQITKKPDPAQNEQNRDDKKPVTHAIGLIQNRTFAQNVQKCIHASIPQSL